MVFVAARLVGSERRTSRFAAPLWVVSVATLAIPVVAFTSGWLPEGAQETRPQRAQVAPSSGITANLEGLAARHYAVDSVSALGSVVATVSASGESFDTRFSGWRGTLSADPEDLAAPFTVQIEIDSAPADTGVDLRSKHAAEYLQAEAYPQIRLDVAALDATERSADGTLTFGATGTLAFMGETLQVAIQGEFDVLTAAERSEHGIAGGQALLVSAAFTVPIADTPLRSDAGDFSADQIPIFAKLLFTPTDNR